MKKIFKTSLLVFFYLQNTIIISQVIFPKELDKSFINKVFCEQSTFKDEFGGYLSSMNEGFYNSKTQVLNYKINISSDEGIYVVFENKDGYVTTQKIDAFPIWKTNIEPVYDKYGDLLYDKKEVHYKIYTKENKSTDYCSDCIKSVKYTEYKEINGSTKGLFEIVFSVDRGKGLKNKEFMFLLKSGYVNENRVCGTLKTKLELQKEEQERIRNEREIEKRNLEEDSKRIESIESLLSSNQVDLAVEEFKKLHINNENVKQKVQNALNHYYEKKSLVLHPDILSKIISENKDSFKKFKDGQFKIVLNKDGSVSAESKDTTSKKIEICSNRSYLKKDGFEYPATFSGDLTISTDKTKMNAGDSIRYIVSEKHMDKTIYISKEGEYYFRGFGTPATAYECSKPIIYSHDVKENYINLEQLYKYTRNANGIKIEEGKGYFQEKTFVAKKGTGKKIGSIIGALSFPLSFIIALIAFS